MRSIISNSKLRNALIASALTAVFFGAMRCVFFVIPGAFETYPEASFELEFYRMDLRCRTAPQSPRIVLHGTSRLGSIGSIPTGEANPTSGQELMNASIAGQSFWHIAALRRRHRDLFAQSDLAVLDVAPMQAYLGRNFDESSALFFRESTLREKLLIHDPFLRAKALADTIVPAWSRRYRPITWWNALTHLDASDADRLQTLLAQSGDHFPEVEELVNDLKQAGNDIEKIMEIVATIDFPPGALSEVQLHALREIVDSTPPDGYTVLFYPTFNDAFTALIQATPLRVERERSFKSIVESVARPNVLVYWMEIPRGQGLENADFAFDGAHFARTGVDKIRNGLGLLYQELFSVQNARPAQPQ